MSILYATVNDTIADVLPDVSSGNAAQVASLTRIINAVSAMIDSYTKRPPGYFLALANNSAATVRRYRGTGANYLQIGRHVAGSVTINSVANSLFYEHPDNGWIFAVDNAGQPGSLFEDETYKVMPCNLFAAGALYLVSARWGFAAIPDDITLATKLITQHVWDRGKGIMTQITPAGFVVERDMPLTAKTLLAPWIRREFEVT